MIHKDRGVRVRGIPVAMHRHLKHAANNRSEGNYSKELTSFIDSMLNALSPLSAGYGGAGVRYEFVTRNIGISQKRKLAALAESMGVGYGDLIKVFYHIDRLLPEAKRSQNERNGNK